MTTEAIIKLVVAVALTLAMTIGSGVADEKFGLDVVPTVYAGNCGTSAGGGGC